MSQAQAIVSVPPMYLDREGAANFLALSVSTFERLTREDATFPKARALSGNRSGWLVAELTSWGMARPVSTRPPPPNTGSRRRLASA